MKWPNLDNFLIINSDITLNLKIGRKKRLKTVNTINIGWKKEKFVLKIFS